MKAGPGSDRLCIEVVTRDEVIPREPLTIEAVPWD